MKFSCRYGRVRGADESSCWLCFVWELIHRRYWEWICFRQIVFMDNSLQAMWTTTFTSFIALLSLALAANSTMFQRGSSHMPIPNPISRYSVASEVQCALSCSTNVLCEFYQFNTTKHMCSQYQAPGWPADAVTADADAYASFKGRTSVCTSDVLSIPMKLIIFYIYDIGVV